MSKFYRLEGHDIVECRSLREWDVWMATADRHVGSTEIGCLWISTVFLGIDHNWFGGEPLLFETMIFNDDEDADYCQRCCTWEQAEVMHAEAVKVAEVRIRLADFAVQRGLNAKP